MNSLRFFCIVFAFVPLSITAAQTDIPDWENPAQIQFPTGNSVESAFSNGYGPSCTNLPQSTAHH
jgi:hypothetical protein